MLYLSVVDDTTHRYGPETPRTARAVATADRAVARLLDGIAALPVRDSVNVIVLSDHGMRESAQDRMIPLRPILAEAGIDTSAVQMGDNGPTMSLWFGGDTVVARRTLAALRRGLSHARAYAPSEAPAAWHVEGNVRAGEVLVVADPGWVLAKGARDRVLDVGTHGWDPVDPAMHGIFIAAGPQVAGAKAIPAFESVHVYPFIAAMLRLERAPRADADASVLAPYLRRGH
jgi:alkaline phosphatase D